MDLDGDGVLDVLSGRYQPGTVYWFRGEEDGAFGKRQELLVAKYPNDMETAMATANAVDWDGDGDFDLVLGNVKGRVFLSLNEGSKTEPVFTKREQLMADGAPMKVVQKSDPWPVDWDGDGTLDLLVGDENGDASFFRGRGDGTFDQGVSLFTGVTVDPKRGYRESKALLNEKGRVIPGYRLRLSTFDWNGDGKLDLLVGNCETGPTTVGPDGKKKRGTTTGHVRVLLRR